MRSLSNAVPTRAPQVVGSNFGFHQHSFDYFLDGMAELGLHEIELWAVAGHYDFLGGGEEETQRVAGRLAASDIRVHCLTVEQVMYPINVAAADRGLARRSIDHFRRAADVAASWGTPLLFLTSGRGVRDEPREAAWERAVAAVAEIVSHAAQQDVTCVLEPLQPHESNLPNDLTELSRFVADVDDPRLQVALDTVAMAAAGDTVDAYFDAFPGRVGHVQVVDGRPAGHLAWGDGDLPLDSYVADLLRRGYAGKVSFEVFGPPAYREDPLARLHQCISGFTQALERDGA
jgi:protein FrlC